LAFDFWPDSGLKDRGAFVEASAAFLAFGAIVDFVGACFLFVMCSMNETSHLIWVNSLNSLLALSWLSNQEFRFLD
jgi:hypothetical protein